MLRKMTNRPATVGIILAFLAVILLPIVGRADEMPGLSVHDVAALRLVNQVEISPGGKRQAYTLVVPRVPGEEEDGGAWSELWVTGDDGAPRPFIGGKVNVGNIAWTSDGSAIAFLAKRGDDEHKALYSIPLAAARRAGCSSHGDGDPRATRSPPTASGWRSWPSGRGRSRRQSSRRRASRQIVYEEEWRPVELWMTEVEGDGFSEPTCAGARGSASKLSWSPAGDKIAVALAPTSLIDDAYMFASRAPRWMRRAAK